MQDDPIPDMTQIQHSHCPELAFRPDLPSPLAGTAVGWLGATVPETGTVPPDVLETLHAAKAGCPIDAGERGFVPFVSVEALDTVQRVKEAGTGDDR